jgi:hypothetical protein
MNNTMVHEIRGAKLNPKSSFKNYGAQNKRGRKLREQIRYLVTEAGMIVGSPTTDLCVLIYII